ncbi:translation protein SH3-like protein [Delitschia confertaspora ATCC 74209]|uniref:Translation protein SH3-like protein n=1 Tax=Delitschia confertaspora ATCC 74209 TaxID=1513339 RepID=A0A9P4JMV0_9PLEO|nr:translation protein SH3-like protein [Delitschia confertaspora ATCC 74209]
MGYYDEDGHYHSFRHGLHKVAERIAHPIHGHNHHGHKSHSHSEPREEIVIKEKYTTSSAPAPTTYSAPTPAPRVSAPAPAPAPISRVSSRSSTTMAPPNTITIPCHHIRIGDLLILQGRPCQVIRITTSSQTGQHRYLGVDLFTKQLHEESSFISNPAPSVVVQNMLGPVFKQYRVLDIREDGRVVAMTETGDVKQGLPVLDQSGLLKRLTEAFDNGRGSVRILVINDDGVELAVDFKVVHGSRL